MMPINLPAISNNILSKRSFCLHFSTSSAVIVSLQVNIEKPNFNFCQKDNEEKALFNVILKIKEKIGEIKSRIKGIKSCSH